jgi:endogenous inhibitor of DNA gyrase (YacG/DUF329 family)
MAKFKKGITPWNRNKIFVKKKYFCSVCKSIEVKRKTRYCDVCRKDKNFSKVLCSTCGKVFKIVNSHFKRSERHFCNRKCYAKDLSNRQKGEKNSSWKGEQAGYSALHRYLRDHFTKQNCDSCGVIYERLEFALKKGRRYTRNIEDYLILCSFCHIKYDAKLKGSTKLSTPPKP